MAEKDDTEMEKILDKLGFSQKVKENFKKEKVYISTVQLLDREQLRELGVETLGEFAVLKEACKQTTGYCKVASEVKRIMQPLPSSAPSSSGITGSASSLINIQRRIPPKKKKSNRAGSSSVKSQTFQKRLVVFKYMGHKAPYSFTRREDDILFRGLLSELSTDDCELVIRDAIMVVLHSSKSFDLKEFGLYDFEFMDVHGKNVNVPACDENHRFNGKSIKQLAGTGPVYIRLTKKIPPRAAAPVVISDDSDFECPKDKVTRKQYSSDSDFELPSYLSIPSMKTGTSVSPSLIGQSSPSGQQINSITPDPLSSLSSDQRLNTTTANPTGLSSVSSGQRVNTTTANPIGLSSVSSGQRVNTTTANPIGLSSVSSGQQVNTTTTNPIGLSSVSSGQQVNTTTTNPIGLSSVSSGQRVNTITANPIGLSSVSSGHMTTANPIGLSSVSSGQQVNTTTTNPIGLSSVSSCQQTNTTMSDPSTNHLSSVFMVSTTDSLGTEAGIFRPADSGETATSSDFGRLHLPFYSIERLCEKYPTLSNKAITTVFEVSGWSYSKTVDFLDNRTLENLLDMLYDNYINLCTEESPKLQIEESATENEIAEAVLGFYKSSRFNNRACVRVTNPRAIDSGGVRRQTYATAFQAIAKKHLHMFEGPFTRVTPAIQPCNTVSGVLKNLGEAIAHELVMDKCGFPFLSPPIFYYLVGMADVAITLLEDCDLSGQAFHVVTKIKTCNEGCELLTEKEDLQYLERVLDECGSNLLINIDNKDSILQTIIVHNGLEKRKVFLDSISEGLEVYKIHSLMKVFPELFKPAFTDCGMHSSEVIGKICPCDDLDDHMLALVSCLFDFISDLSENEMKCFLCLVTGSPFMGPDCILLKFTHKEDDPPFAFFTCTRTIVLSSLISNYEGLKLELKVLIREKSFTMA